MMREENITTKRKENLKKASEKVSNLVRQLSFAGIAIIWIIKSGSNLCVEGINILLLISMLLIILSVFSELVHYTIETICNKSYIYKPEKTIPMKYAHFAWVMWWIKVALTVTAYLLIGLYLAYKIF